MKIKFIAMFTLLMLMLSGCAQPTGIQDGPMPVPVKVRDTYKTDAKALFLEINDSITKAFEIASPYPNMTTQEKNDFIDVLMKAVNQVKALDELDVPDDKALIHANLKAHFMKPMLGFIENFALSITTNDLDALNLASDFLDDAAIGEMEWVTAMK